MFAEVQKCINNNDIKGLRYIFVDSLDVDPTFELYREDYEYICNNKKEMFEPHKEISPMLSNKNCWTLQYWNQLKIDLMKNFSKERFEHMILVAPVVYKNKVSRLIAERNKKNEERSVDIPMSSQFKKIKQPQEFEPKRKVTESKQQQEWERIEQKKKALEEENRRIKAEEQAQQNRLKERSKQYNSSQSNELKKAMGIALGVAIIIIGVVIIVIIL